MRNRRLQDKQTSRRPSRHQRRAHISQRFRHRRPNRRPLLRDKLLKLNLVRLHGHPPGPPGQHDEVPLRGDPRDLRLDEVDDGVKGLRGVLHAECDTGEGGDGLGIGGVSGVTVPDDVVGGVGGHAGFGVW